MLRVALASVLGNRIRLALTSLAIVLGVAFVAGSLMLTDSIERAFGTLFDDSFADTDVYVRGVRQVDIGFGGELPGQGPTIPEDLADVVVGIDGVRDVVPMVEGIAQVIDPDGAPVGGMGPPTIGASWSGPDEAGPLTLRDGRPAAGPDEATIDAGTAGLTGYGIGDPVPILLASGVETFELVGITGYGTEDNLLGATIVTFDLQTAQQVLGRVGRLDSLAVVGDGVRPDELRDRIATVVASDTVEVVTADQEAAEAQALLEEGLSFINIALLAFAGIAVFVGMFLIVNTFSMVVAQRTREFALLRAVGASTRQVQGAVVIEALVVGMVSAVLGLLAGVGLSNLLRLLFDALGVGFPDGGLVLRARTVVVAFAVGVGVTMLAALGPARRASRIAPVEALAGTGAANAERVSRRRTAAGVALALVGGVGIAVALGGMVPQPAAVAGLGAAATFVGVTLFSPLLSQPVVGLVGAAPARRGLAGLLARNNAQGNPRRTAATASALMIGVALVSFVSIFAASATASVNTLFTAQLRADFVISPVGFGQAGIPAGLWSTLQAQPEVGATSPLRVVQGAVGEGAAESVVAVVPDHIDRLVALDVSQGNVDDLLGGVLVHVDRATADDLAIGDPVTLRLQDGSQELTVAGLFGNRDLVSADVIIALDTIPAGSTTPGADVLVLVAAADGVDLDDARSAVDGVVEAFPSVQVEDQAELRDSLQGQVDGLLNLMIGLLGLALVVALIGIVNTLALSVFERTREIGLLRAVGMTRGQVRTMIRWEAVYVSVFGALLGVAVGTLLGWAIVAASADQGLEVLEVPVLRLATYVVVAGVAGVAAAVLPARRAARLDVLEAVTTE
jgi:putative ABC transport system permease protein